jgi:hypothetical protein
MAVDMVIPVTTTEKFAKIRHGLSGLMALAGTSALTLMAVRQSKVPHLQAQDLWLVGLMVAVTFEAIGNYFRPAAVGPKVSIWSLTLMGCSCLVGGFALKQGLIVALGGALIAAGYVMAVCVPAVPNMATSDNASRKPL